MDKQNSPTFSSGQIIRWVWQFVTPYKTQVFWAVVFLLAGAASWLALGQGVRVLVDKGFSADSVQDLDQALIFIITVTLVSSGATFGRFYLMTWLGERVSADIRLSVYQHLLLLSPAYYAKQRTGEVISRFTADSTLLQSVVGSSLSMALRSSVSLLGALVMMFATSLKLSMMVLVAVPFVLVPILFFGRKVRTHSRNSQDKVGDMSAFIDESLHEISTVQAYNYQTQAYQGFVRRIDKVIEAAKLRIFYRALLMSSMMFLSIGAISFVTWMGAQSVIDGEVSPGELTAFMFYAVMVAGAVATVSEVIGEIQRAVGATERLLELGDAPIDIQDPINPVSLPPQHRGEIRVDGLKFHYENNDQAVFDQLSLHINPGERVALVGPSGAGKSTLFQLLLRFQTPNKGKICLDGVDISSTSLSELRQNFALVSQESVIFANDVIDNVRFGRTTATEEEVIAACKLAQAHDFIQELPDGYQTYLGERGVRLSGGQKQRIAIARAILAARPILLLDEATSALDAVSEKKVKLALDELMKNKTSLIIAHRLATVNNVDRILVMDKGQIVASGTHKELLENNALYREFAQLQLLE
ncbi:ABC transporter transmembrane domain-containing protein [Vibrio sp. SCSIO 43136]|uniref:ABC transporter transmembrane domain-containing protein n=1 Tax=Vibrio sp. SCSIO 43136 TaxID=2819101 RepID=UPI002076537A|nr:ABC transporter transmembrane domain-containing protein [Vibrio sp. SCSIO 43136]USD66934.1 ATP-binding cassette domain-containing protein [Vibrio sp. SCSIO 43136]